MKWIRGVTMWTVAVLLLGAQAKATPVRHSAVWCDSRAPMQASASNRVTEEGARSAPTGAAVEGWRERPHSMSSTFHLEALYRWHHEATRLP